MKSWYEIKESAMGSFRCWLKSHDGRVLLETPSFPSKEEVLRAIEELRGQCVRVESYTRHMAQGGKNYFSIRKGGEQVYLSWLYDSERALDKAIEELVELAGVQTIKFV